MRNEKVLYKNNIIRTKDYRQTFFLFILISFLSSNKTSQVMPFLCSVSSFFHNWPFYVSTVTIIAVFFVLFYLSLEMSVRDVNLMKNISTVIFWINCHFFKSTKLRTYKYAKEIVSVTVSQIDDRTNVIDTALINTSQTLIQVFFRSYNKKPHYYPHIKHWFSDR